ncbi:hypothetical protein Nepgr_031440 [Nepenthes gracilis]|uniref:Cellulose synthase-like protein E6 n=1 Tax=Nepenthes gracilis TaxID=150966 RepID=A0AAD3TIU7_NEPGR|nr:hypothetical protein Nepgr_031440 [Nepenthes gracilis]
MGIQQKALPLQFTISSSSKGYYQDSNQKTLHLQHGATHVPEKGGAGRWAWIGLFAAELWLGFHCLLSLLLRWNIIYRHTFKDRLKRYEHDLPGVDIFVCTADPTLEPPILVINTVLALMAYDYPTEKLSVYLSDDGGSDLTFYALLEASDFSKHWLPYCRKYNVEPRSPAVYFRSVPKSIGGDHAVAFASIKTLYEEMKNRVETTTKLGRIPAEIRAKHNGFSKWDSFVSRNDHDAIVQIVIDGRNPNEKDIEGLTLPSLVYLAREKRPHHFHHFKAGSMNALIRVSSEITKGQIILNVDCDMYSNNSQAVRDALCFFMDEKKGHQIAYVQFPQRFENLTKNELYGTSLRIPTEVELHGLDGCGGSNYIGSGCFHRREAISGMKFSKDLGIPKRRQATMEGSVEELEEKAKAVASCSYELNTQWGKEMGVKYGIAVEDFVTGLGIQCKGWKSVYFNPERPGFVGLAPTSLSQVLAQQKRWGEGNLQITLSRYCPLVYGHNRISLVHQLAYCHYNLRAVNSLPTVYYCTVPALCMAAGIPLFPEVSNPWFLPFVYIVVAKCSSSLSEFLYCKGTAKGYWNGQRIWLYKQTSSYLFAFVDTILNLVGLSNMKFAVTAKVSEDDVSKRYEKEIMEFGVSSPIFTVLTTLALLNLLCLAVGAYKVAVEGWWTAVLETMALQIWLCGAFVLINLPLYEAVFSRKDKGRMPSSVAVKSAAIVGLIVLYFCNSQCLSADLKTVFLQLMGEKRTDLGASV